MKSQRGSGGGALLLPSALVGGTWSTPCPGSFTGKKILGTHYTGGWIGLRAGLDGC